MKNTYDFAGGKIKFVHCGHVADGGPSKIAWEAYDANGLVKSGETLVSWGAFRFEAEKIAFDLVEPLPREAKQPLSLEEVQRRLKERFGN